MAGAYWEMPTLGGEAAAAAGLKTQPVLQRAEQEARITRVSGAPPATVIGMDHRWAADQLDGFVRTIDALVDLTAINQSQELDDYLVEARESILSVWEGGTPEIVDALIMMDPAMRMIMEAARPGLGSYLEAPGGGWSVNDADYWRRLVRHSVLRAKGIHERGAEVRRRMRPDSPELIAEQFHPWAWEAASPLWSAGSRQEAVHAAARSVNARLQQKLGRHDASDAKLCREAFSLSDPVPGQPRLRFDDDRSSETWRSRQNGGIQFGAGCFEGIRNLAAHQHELDLPEQVVLEQLAAFSLLSRWIENCEVERAAVPSQALAPDSERA